MRFCTHTFLSVHGFRLRPNSCALQIFPNGGRYVFLDPIQVEPYVGGEIDQIDQPRAKRLGDGSRSNVWETSTQHGISDVVLSHLQLDDFHEFFSGFRLGNVFQNRRDRRCISQRVGRVEEGGVASS